jgi:hypothetical protein
MELDKKSQLYSICEQIPLSEGVFLAGGAIRRHFEGYGQTEGDFDIFITSSASADVFRGEMNAKPGWELVPTGSGTRSWTGEIDGEPIKVQLIEFHAYSQITICLSWFDFTVNQGAVQWTDDGFRMRVGTETVNDIRDRALRVVRPRTVPTLMKRTQKMVRLGYYMPDDEAMLVSQLIKAGYITASASELEESYFPE